MTGRKWTPGPWTAYDFAGGWWIASDGDDSGPIFRVNGPHYDRQANAHLIAAAPEMYEALERVQQLIVEAAMTGFNYKDGDWAERLYESNGPTSRALSIARGETNA